MTTSNVVFVVKFDYFGKQQKTYFGDKESAYKQGCLWIVESLEYGEKQKYDLNKILKRIKNKDFKGAIKYYNDSEKNYGYCEIKDYTISDSVDEKEFNEYINKIYN